MRTDEGICPYFVVSHQPILTSPRRHIPSSGGAWGGILSCHWSILFFILLSFRFGAGGEAFLPSWIIHWHLHSICSLTHPILRSKDNLRFLQRGGCYIFLIVHHLWREISIEGNPVLPHKSSHKICVSNKDQVSSQIRKSHYVRMLLCLKILCTSVSYKSLTPLGAPLSVGEGLGVRPYHRSERTKLIH